MQVGCFNGWIVFRLYLLDNSGMQILQQILQQRLDDLRIQDLELM